MAGSPLKARRVVLAARPVGKPRLTDFRLEDFDVHEPAQGELLLRTLYLSLDPYMRGNMDDRASYSPPIPLGGTMRGEVIAEVLHSRHSEYQAGDIIATRVGWVSHAISDGTAITKLDARYAPVTTALGVLGMPGFTAYGGLLNIGEPKPGETVVVAAATGPVGSLVGQIAKIKGARSVGIAGGKDKCAFLVDELRFDAAVDHRAPDFPLQLAEACPTGIDIYFENVGGAVWQAVLPLLNLHARVPVCGLVAQYNGAVGQTDPNLLAETMRQILSRRLRMEGFINTDFEPQRSQFLSDVSSWIADGRVRFREETIPGLENAPAAFIGMLEGRNFGKLIIDLSR